MTEAFVVKAIFAKRCRSDNLVEVLLGDAEVINGLGTSEKLALKISLQRLI